MARSPGTKPTSQSQKPRASQKVDKAKTAAAAGTEDASSAIDKSGVDADPAQGVADKGPKTGSTKRTISAKTPTGKRQTSSKTRTIDLDPSEITRHKAKHEAKTATGTQIPKPDAPDGKKPPIRSDQTRAQTTGSASKTATPSTQAKDGKATSPPKTPGSRGPNRASFGTLFLAGAIGGLLGCLGILAILGSGLWSADTGMQDAQLAALTEQVSKLEQDIDNNQTIATGSDMLSSSVAGLEQRLSAAETNITTLSSDIGDEIRAQIADFKTTQEADIRALETRLQALTTAQSDLQQALTQGITGASGGASEGATGAASGEAAALGVLNRALEEIQAAQTQLERDVTALKANAANVTSDADVAELIAQLQKQIEEQEQLENLADNATKDMQARLTRLRGELDETKATMDIIMKGQEQDSVLQSQNLEIVLAHMRDNLSAAAQSGQPFGGLYQDLSALNNARTLNLPLGALEDGASRGLMPLDDLEYAISQTRRARLISLDSTSAQTDERTMTADGLLDGLMQGASSLVRIRRLNQAEELAPVDSVDALAIAAARAASARDVPTLVSSLEALPESFSPSLAEWRNQAQGWKTLYEVLDVLQDRQKALWADDKGRP